MPASCACAVSPDERMRIQYSSRQVAGRTRNTTLIRGSTGRAVFGTVALAGDFNVVPTDEDIYNPKSWRRDALLQPESRAAWFRLLEQGWTDALGTLHPTARIYTFWDYFRDHWPRDAGLRIDHILLNAELAPRLRKAGVDRWVRDVPKASDHAPTWVELAR